ncbi:MAG: creatininase, partial [Candidatus Rokuibacteriota bacterium]
PDDVMVLALPPTMFGKSVEHITFPGTLTFSGDTLRMVLRDLAASVARSGFTKLVLLGSHGGNVGTTDDYFRDLRMETDLRVFKIFLGGIAQVPGLVAPEEAAIAMHSGDSETSMVRHLAPELVHMDRAEGYVFDSTPDIGYSFKGHDVIEAWVASDLSKTGAIGNPHRSSADKGRLMCEAKAVRLAELLESIYRSPKREIHLAPKETP